MTKTIIRISAILNLLLVVAAFICTVIAAINKSGAILSVSAVVVIASVFSATLMLVLCNDFKEK